MIIIAIHYCQINNYSNSSNHKIKICLDVRNGVEGYIFIYIYIYIYIYIHTHTHTHVYNVVLDFLTLAYLLCEI